MGHVSSSIISDEKVALIPKENGITWVMLYDVIVMISDEKWEELQRSRVGQSSLAKL